MVSIKYNFDTVKTVSENSKDLIYAREQFKNGDVLFYSASPPLLILETFLVHRDIEKNIIKKDTLYGPNIQFNVKGVASTVFEIAAIDTTKNISNNIIILENFTYSTLTMDSLFDTGLIYK